MYHNKELYVGYAFGMLLAICVILVDTIPSRFLKNYIIIDKALQVSHRVGIRVNDITGLIMLDSSPTSDDSYGTSCMSAAAPTPLWTFVYSRPRVYIHEYQWQRVNKYRYGINWTFIYITLALSHNITCFFSSFFSSKIARR